MSEVEKGGCLARGEAGICLSFPFLSSWALITFDEALLPQAGPSAH